MRTRTVLAAIAPLLFAGVAHAQLVGYHIGNSLTWDSQPEAIAEFARLQNRPLAVGYHINCNRSLDQIIIDPDTHCVTPVQGFGLYDDALPAFRYDYVTVQPFWTETSTLQTDLASFVHFDQMLDAQPGSEDTIIYLYQGWGAWTFMLGDGWFEPLDDPGLNTPTSPHDAYFQMLFPLLDDLLDRELRLIPMGQVLMELRDRVYDDEIPGVISISRFFRDDIHMSNGLGRFTAAATSASVILDSPPFGMHRAWIAEFGSAGYTSETYLAIEYAIWDVISAEPRTGVHPCLGDVNRDGSITPQDFNAWIYAYQNDLPIADQNKDGHVSPRDFNAWINNFNNACN